MKRYAREDVKIVVLFFFFFQAEDGIRDLTVTGVQTCALPICYTSFGREHAKGFDAPDLKEFFQYGQTVEDNDPIKKEYPENVTVEEVPEFTPTLYKAYRNFEKSGKALLQAIALYLDLDENYFDEYVHNGNSILRAIHYPPITSEPKSAIRAEQHEDINLITLLVGASADGLQILTKKNEWVGVTSLPEQIVVNVGDMLQRLTNNRLKSTTHQIGRAHV